MNTREKIDKLRQFCKCEVNISFNEHRNSRQSLKDWLAFIDAVEDEVQHHVLQEILDQDELVAIQYYPDTPVGFHRVLHYDLDLALDEALANVGIEGASDSTPVQEHYNRGENPIIQMVDEIPFHGSSVISIAGLDKAEVLARLFNASRAQGRGLDMPYLADMSKEEAQRHLDAAEDGYFDYLKGRVMKVDLSGDHFDPRLYDRDNGPGAAEVALMDLLPKTVGGLFRTYIKIPQEIEAVQFTEKYKDRVFHQLTGPTTPSWEDDQPILKVQTIHGDTAIVRLGDWIVKEEKPGCYYPVVDSVFQNTMQDKQTRGSSLQFAISFIEETEPSEHIGLELTRVILAAKRVRARLVRQDLKNGLTYMQVATKYGLDPANIRKIEQGAGHILG